MFSTSLGVCLNRLTITPVGMKYFIEVLQKFSTTGHSVHLRLFPAAVHMATAFLLFFVCLFVLFFLFSLKRNIYM